MMKTLLFALSFIITSSYAAELLVAKNGLRAGQVINIRKDGFRWGEGETNGVTFEIIKMSFGDSNVVVGTRQKNFFRRLNRLGLLVYPFKTTNDRERIVIKILRAKELNETRHITFDDVDAIVRTNRIHR